MRGTCLLDTRCGKVEYWGETEDSAQIWAWTYKKGNKIQLQCPNHHHHRCYMMELHWSWSYAFFLLWHQLHATSSPSVCSLWYICYRLNFISGQNEFNQGWFVISLYLVFIIIKRGKEITNQARLNSFWPEIKLTCNVYKSLSNQVNARNIIASMLCIHIVVVVFVFVSHQC